MTAHMTAWERWALADPVSAGIDLAREALYWSEDADAAAAEGTDGWHLAPCLDAVRDTILSAAEAELRARGRR